ncbi:MAG: 50S ribosomal protein L18Ae [Candidatus Heimdallarchaeota archaeon]|nr:50S ribosomal protein L18Ae [Candidatus Heimdallarchaeota archaeon]MDH5645489.1 50S ribosomal protein L18Ae [Candidatus Heimdallarchaeota archaeon]
MASLVKIYQVSGFYLKGKTKIPLFMECRGVKETDVLEKVYSEIGSRHKVKRENILISKKDGIKEISIDNAKTLQFIDIDSDDFKLNQ